MNKAPIWLDDYEMETLCGYVGELLAGRLPGTHRQVFDRLYEQIKPEARSDTQYEMPLDITEELCEILDAENIEEALEELIARRGYDETKERSQ